MTNYGLPDDYKRKARDAWFRVALRRRYVPQQPFDVVPVARAVVSLRNFAGELARLAWNGHWFDEIQLASPSSAERLTAE